MLILSQTRSTQKAEQDKKREVVRKVILIS